MDTLTLQVLAITFFATLVRSTFGFGEAMVAVPLLSLRLPVTVATPLAVLLSITVAGVVVAQDWRHIHVRSAGGLLLASVLGIPLGLWLLKSGDERIVKTILGALLIAFSIYSLFARDQLHLQQDHRGALLACGLIAGILGGAYGMNGPPLVVYGAMRRWSPQHFRSTLQAYFLPASLLGMIGYLAAGLWTMQVTRYFLFSLPLTLIGIAIGRAVNQKLQGQSFLRYAYVGLIAIGGTLIFHSLLK